MLPRFLGTLVLATALIFGAMGAANAGTDNGIGNNGQNNGNAYGRYSAPELDPTSLASGIILLAGGFLVLHECRRKKDQRRPPMRPVGHDWNCASGLSRQLDLGSGDRSYAFFPRPPGNPFRSALVQQQSARGRSKR